MLCFMWLVASLSPGCVCPCIVILSVDTAFVALLPSPHSTAALDDELERLRQEAQSLVEELEEQLAASATSQRLQDDLDRLDAGGWHFRVRSAVHVSLLLGRCVHSRQAPPPTTPVSLIDDGPTVAALLTTKEAHSCLCGCHLAWAGTLQRSKQRRSLVRKTRPSSSARPAVLRSSASCAPCAAATQPRQQQQAGEAAARGQQPRAAAGQGLGPVALEVLVLMGISLLGGLRLGRQMWPVSSAHGQVRVHIW